MTDEPKTDEASADRKVFSLVERRPPEPLGWTPETCVAEFLEDIRLGKIRPVRLAIYWMEANADGSWSPRSWTQGMTWAEEVALAEMAKLRALEAARS